MQTDKRAEVRKLRRTFSFLYVCLCLAEFTSNSCVQVPPESEGQTLLCSKLILPCHSDQISPAPLGLLKHVFSTSEKVRVVTVSVSYLSRWFCSFESDLESRGQKMLFPPPCPYPTQPPLTYQFLTGLGS